MRLAPIPKPDPVSTALSRLDKLLLDRSHAATDAAHKHRWEKAIFACRRLRRSVSPIQARSQTEAAPATGDNHG